MTKLEDQLEEISYTYANAKFVSLKKKIEKLKKSWSQKYVYIILSPLHFVTNVSFDMESNAQVFPKCIESFFGPDFCLVVALRILSELKDW